MFAHLVFDINRNINEKLKIFATEGNPWDLLKDWDVNWRPHFGSNNNFNYEFVEMLSYYVNAIICMLNTWIKQKALLAIFIE